MSKMTCSTQAARFVLFWQVFWAVNLTVNVIPVFVVGLKENETLVDDFDSGTANFWQIQKPNSFTVWYLTMHGDPAPLGFDSLRPPMEESSGGFLEVVPISDSPAQIYSDVMDFLPGATVELTYWNVVDIPLLQRNTVLNLYTVENVTEIQPSFKSMLVFNAPPPADPSSGWVRVTIDLKLITPSRLQVRSGFLNLKDVDLFSLSVTAR